MADTAAPDLADVPAYLPQISAACGVDPLAALSEKIDHNESLFPPRVRALKPVGWAIRVRANATHPCVTMKSPG